MKMKISVNNAHVLTQQESHESIDDRLQSDNARQVPKPELIDHGTLKMGQMISESVTKKVVMLVLLLVLCLPWFEPTGNSFTDAAETAFMLWEYHVKTAGGSNSITDDDVSNSLNTLRANIGTRILYLEYLEHNHYNNVTDSAVYVHRNTVLNNRRDIEIWKYETSQGSKITFDIRNQIFEEAYLGILLTLFSIFIFTGSTIYSGISTMKLVVDPISRHAFLRIFLFFILYFSNKYICKHLISF